MSGESLTTVSQWNVSSCEAFTQFMNNYEEPHYGIFPRCATEFAGSAFVIFMGESIIANELLARTKGHGMGWGAVAVGFAFSFGTAIMMFNHISGHFNPAMLLGLFIAGKISVGELFLSTFCEFAGGFLGAVLVWLQFLPHFKTVPEPPPDRGDDLLRTRDYLARTGQKYVGNKVWVQHHHSTSIWEEILYFFHLKKDYHAPKNHLYNEAYPEDEDEEQLYPIKEGEVDGQTRMYKAHAELQDIDAKIKGLKNVSFEAHHEDDSCSPLQQAQGNVRRVEGPDVAATLEYKAALLLDQHAKLSIFATRPAIVAPAFNFLCEVMCTFALILGALLIAERGKLIYQTAGSMWEVQEAFLLGWYVFVCILGLGGPTGIAANSMRDCAPRLAHFLLPIPNKGPSEWWYGWIPATAPLVGGMCAGFTFNAINSMNQYVKGG